LAKARNDEKSVKMPAGLSAEAQHLWSQTIEQFEIDDAASLTVLANGCRALDRLRAAEKTLREVGTIYMDRFGTPHSHPCVLQVRDENQTLQRCLKTLGLDLSPVNEIGRPPEGV